MLIGAALTALTLAFPHIGFLQWVTMVPMIFAVCRFCSDEHLTLRRAYRYGFLTVYVYYLVIYHWFVRMHPLDFVGLDGIASIVVVICGWFGLSLLQALVGGFIFLLFRLIERAGVFLRAPFLRPVAFAALWVIFEWSSTLSWVGVPWGRLCLGQIEYLPVLQSASLLGSYFVSFLILLVNGFLAYAFLCPPKRWLCCGIAGALLFSNLAYGLLSSPLKGSEDRTASVAVIQGNINSHDKWSYQSTAKTKEAYGRLTEEAVARGAKLVVWSETAFPFDFNIRGDLQRYASDIAKKHQITLAIGALYLDDDGKEYNAIYLIDPDGTVRDEIYAKRHLVPFGEYVPLQGLVEVLIPPLAMLSDLGGVLAPGRDSALFETEYGKIGSLICFDTIYEQLTLDSIRDGAELMMVCSNDSWFYDSVAVYQHLAQSQLRAIECGRYVLRSANTGVSAIIAPDGRVMEEIDPLIEGYAVTDVASISQNTLYSVIGNLFVYLCLAFITVLGVSDSVRRRFCNQKSEKK